MMGFSFTSTTALAMECEREHAGTASALSSAVGFGFGGLVSFSRIGRYDGHDGYCLHGMRNLLFGLHTLGKEDQRVPGSISHHAEKGNIRTGIRWKSAST